MATRLGEYTLLNPAATGGSGVVWRAVRDDGVAAAVKVLRNDAPDPHHVHALRNEILAVAALDHAHIIRVYDHGTIGADAVGTDANLTEGSPWLALEWCDGGDLAQKRGKLDWPTLREVLVDLLAALGHAHARGVVHRDVKPANVLFTDRGTSIRLADFGLAAARGAGASSRLPGGTRAFMAPEQFAGRAHDHGPGTDLYAVGALTWSLLSTGHPYDSEAPEDAPCVFVPCVPVPDGLESWLRHLLQRVPTDRPAFAADAVRALARIDPLARRDPTAGRPRGRGGRSREHRRLEAALRAVTESGRARCVMLAGPTGIGKSWLAERLCTSAHERGTATWLRADHHPTPEPKDGMRGALLRRYDLTGTDRRTVETRVEVAAALSARERSALVDLLCPVGRDEVPRTTPERHLLVQRQLQRLGRERPLILWLDDVQWGLDTMDLVRHVLRTRLALPTPVLFVVVVRTDALRNRPAARERLGLLSADPASETIDVGPLDPQALRAIGRSMGLAPGLVGHLLARVGGNPHVLRTTVERWDADGRLVEGRGGRALRGSPEPVESALAGGWEDEVQDLLAGREPKWRDALRAAAILGTTVVTSEWSELCRGLGVSANTDVPETLAHRGFAVAEGASAWRFSHAGLREAVLAATPADERRQIHAQAADLLPVAGTADEEARRGRHLAAAGRPEEAMVTLVAAAARHQVLGDPVIAEALLDEAEGAAHDAGLADAGLGSGLLRCRLWRDQHRFDEALSLAERLRTHPETGSFAGRARVERVLGGILWASGRRVDARPILASAAENAARSGDSAIEIDCTTAAGMLRMELGDLAGGEATLRRSISRANDSGTPDLALDAWIGLTNAQVQRRDLDAARQSLTEATKAAQSTGSRPALAQCALLRGELGRAAGTFHEAERDYLDAAVQYDEIGSPAAGPAWLNLGLLAAADGRWSEAARHFRFIRERTFPLSSEAVRGIAALGLAAAEATSLDAENLLSDAIDSLLRLKVANRDIAWLADQVAQRATRTEVARRAADLAVAQTRQLDSNKAAQP